MSKLLIRIRIDVSSGLYPLDVFRSKSFVSERPSGVRECTFVRVVRKSRDSYTKKRSSIAPLESSFAKGSFLLISFLTLSSPFNRVCVSSMLLQNK